MIACAMRLLLVLVLGCLAATARGQALTAADVINLAAAGVPEADIARMLAEAVVKPVFRPADIERIAAAGVARSLLLPYAESAPAGTTPLTLAEIERVHAAGATEEELLKLVRECPARPEVTVADILRLTRAGIPVSVVRALREGTPAPAAGAPSEVRLADVERWTQDGLAPEELVTRIRRSPSKFAVDVDDVVALSRRGVDPAVLKEIWTRRVAADRAPAESAPAPSPRPAAAVSGDAPPAPGDLAIHREAAGEFSLIAPRNFSVLRLSKGVNAILEFTDRTPAGDEIPDIDLAVLRFRAHDPARLVPGSLGHIADNVLNALVARWAEKQVRLTVSNRREDVLSGAPAMRYDLLSAAAGGQTHRGSAFVCLGPESVYLISTLCRTERAEAWSPLLERCLESFTFEAEPKRPAPEGHDRDRVAALADSWRAAVLARDFASYRTLRDSRFETPETRLRFLDLVDEIRTKSMRLAMGDVTLDRTRAEAAVHLIGVDENRRSKIVFRADDEGSWTVIGDEVQSS